MGNFQDISATKNYTKSRADLFGTPDNEQLQESRDEHWKQLIV